MIQMETQSSGSARAHPHQEFYLILYPKELEDEVIQTLEATGVPGYTEMPKMVGRGRHIRHFDEKLVEMEGHTHGLGRARIHENCIHDSSHF